MHDRLLLCAPASGGGKTTVTCALLQALVNRGAAPVAFKCGPDYIDPMFHSEIIGAQSRNLDLFLMGEGAVLRSLGEARSGPAIIEGVMGYYDGIAMTSQASAYELARKTDTPAVLVLDARGRALSAAALVRGFSDFRPDSHICGVILNRISPMLYPRLKEAIEAESGLPVYGFLPDCPDCGLESRHLGLVTASEVQNLRAKLERLSQLAEEHLDLEGLLALAAGAPPLPVSSVSAVPGVSGRPRIAVARDEAFCFYYADSLSYLEELGAELAPFSPLTDPLLPEGISGLYLGGGYPELYCPALADNTGMRSSIRSAVSSGLPTIAECGGFLYLHQTLADENGKRWPMAGVLPASAAPLHRLSRFGYVTLTFRSDGLLGPAGTSLPAHEFHYWESSAPGESLKAQKPLSSRNWDCGWHTETLYAGFPHFHLRGCPQAARRFVERCAAYQQERNEVQKI